MQINNPSASDTAFKLLIPYNFELSKRPIDW